MEAQELMETIHLINLNQLEDEEACLYNATNEGEQEDPVTHDTEQQQRSVFVRVTSKLHLYFKKKLSKKSYLIYPARCYDEGIQPALLQKIGDRHKISKTSEEVILELYQFIPSSAKNTLSNDDYHTISLDEADEFQRVKDTFILEIFSKSSQAMKIIKRTGGVFHNANLMNRDLENCKSFWILSLINFNHPHIELKVEALSEIADEIRQSVTQGAGKALINELSKFPGGDHIALFVQSLPEVYEFGSDIFAADVEYLIKSLNYDAANNLGLLLRTTDMPDVHFLELLAAVAGILFGCVKGHRMKEGIYFFIIELVGLSITQVRKYLPPRIFGGLGNIFKGEEIRYHLEHLLQSSGVAMDDSPDYVPQLELCPSRFQTENENFELQARWEAVRVSLNIAIGASQSHGSAWSKTTPNPNEQVIRVVEEVKKRLNPRRKGKLSNEGRTAFIEADKVVNKVLEIFLEKAEEIERNLGYFEDGLNIASGEKNSDLDRLALRRNGKVFVRAKHLWEKHIEVLEAEINKDDHSEQVKCIYTALHAFFKSEETYVANRDKLFCDYKKGLYQASYEFTLSMKQAAKVHECYRAFLRLTEISMAVMLVADLVSADWSWIGFWVGSGISLLSFIAAMVCFIKMRLAVTRGKRSNLIGIGFHSPKTP